MRSESKRGRAGARRPPAKGDSARVLVLLAALCPMGAAGAGPASSEAPSRAETRSADLAGPRVDLVGSVVRQLEDGGDTCLMLDVAGSPRAWLPPPLPVSGPVVACFPGRAGDPVFKVRATLRVKGNLGVARWRRLGDEVVELPLLAEAVLIRERPAGGYGDRGSDARSYGPPASAQSYAHPYPALYPPYSFPGMGIPWPGGAHYPWY